MWYLKHSNFTSRTDRKNGITVLWCSATTASDPLICSDGHFTNAGCQAVTVSARLWQQRMRVATLVLTGMGMGMARWKL